MKSKFPLFFVLSLAFLVRVYRIGDLLGFYFDQGRDALVIWRFWHQAKLFLVGPTTGIEGVLRGPWYYWLIAPWYLLGGGDPIWPSVFLSATTVASLGILYYLGRRLGGHASGMLSVIIGGFSFYLVQASRWLSNPTPMFLISLLIILCLLNLSKSSTWSWLGLGFLLGQAMQFGSSTEIFYFPAIAVILAFNRDKIPHPKVLASAAALLMLSFVPQVLFDIRHQGILRSGLSRFLTAPDTFQVTLQSALSTRLPFYYQVFVSKLFPMDYSLGKYFLPLFGLSLIINFKKFSSDYWKIFLIFISPLVGMLFFHGNFGNVYDYYFTGFYFIFILLFSVSLVKLLPSRAYLLIPSVFLIVFFWQNLPILVNYLRSGNDGPTTVNYGTSSTAVDWVLKDAGQTPFNADIYVPPVIPHVYDYLFLWRAGQPPSSPQPLVYLIYEVDTAHPQFLSSWLFARSSSTRLISSTRFGGVTVERRSRLP